MPFSHIVTLHFWFYSYILVDLIEAGEPRGMPEHEITAFAQKVEASAYIETSAKTGHEVFSQYLLYNIISIYPTNIYVSYFIVYYYI